MFKGEKVRELINERGVTKVSVYTAIGISKKGLEDIIKGNHTCRVSHLEALAKYFNVPIEYFFEDSDGNPSVGHRVNGNWNSVQGDITMSEHKATVEHLKQIIEEKERTIQILLRQVEDLKASR